MTTPEDFPPPLDHHRLIVEAVEDLQPRLDLHALAEVPGGPGPAGRLGLHKPEEALGESLTATHIAPRSEGHPPPRPPRHFESGQGGHWRELEQRQSCFPVPPHEIR